MIPARRDDYPSRPVDQYSPPPRNYDQQPSYEAPAYRSQFSQQALYQPPAPHLPHQQYQQQQQRRQSGNPPSPPTQHQRGRQDSSTPRDEFSRSAPSRPESPSASVVFLGLPLHVDDAGLRAFLEDIGASVDETTIIYDRATNLSKRYGFAKFASVEHARAFLEPNFPTVTWREPLGRGHDADNGLKININYSQKSGGWRDDHGAGARVSEDSRNAAGTIFTTQTVFKFADSRS